jgi:hypothetical protein
MVELFLDNFEYKTTKNCILYVGWQNETGANFVSTYFITSTSERSVSKLVSNSGIFQQSFQFPAHGNLD